MMSNISGEDQCYSGLTSIVFQPYWKSFDSKKVLKL